MLLHLLRLLSRALVDFPTVISGNWLSIALPFVVFLAAEGYNYRRGGWGSVTPTLKRDVWIMTTAYCLLFVWSVVRTVYSDHKDMVAAASKFKSQWHQTQQNDAQTLQSVKSDLGGKISDLKVACARNEGVADTLGKQNRDQQNTINNCQTQALHLLEPKPMHWKGLALEKPEIDTAHRTETARWLLITNQERSSPEFIFTCDLPIIDADSKVAGNVYDTRTVDMGGGRWGTKIFTPSWGPEAPILVVTTLSNPNNTQGKAVQCEFHLQ